MPLALTNTLSQLNAWLVGVLILALVSGCGGDPQSSSSSYLSVASAISSVKSTSSIVIASSASSLSAGPINSSSEMLSTSSAAQSASSASASPTLVFEENTAGFCRFDGVIATEHTGFLGQGFVDSANQVGAKITWQLNAATSQAVQLVVRYGNGKVASRPASFAVNGEVAATSEFVTTNTWTAWTNETLNLTLAAGTNSLTLSANSAEGLANIDSIAISGIGVRADVCPPEVATIATDKWFAIVNRASGLAITVKDMSTAGGAALLQSTRSDSDNQLFRFVSSGNQSYRLIAKHSALAMDLLDFNLEEGADYIQWEDLNGENQRFEILGNNNYFQLVNQLSGKALAPEDDSTAASARLSQYIANFSNNAQQWQLMPVANYDGATVGIDEGDYYVSLDGSDNNPGTRDRPFRNLQKAIDKAEAGDLVLVRGGVYEITNKAVPEAGVNFWKSGKSDSNRIRYFAYPGEKPIFDFAKMPLLADPNYTHGFKVTASYIHMKGFELRNVRMNTRSNVGISIEGNANRDIFEELDIHHMQGSGMFFRSKNTGGHLILNSDSHDNYDPYSHQGDGQNADGFGVHYQVTGDSIIFRGCRAWWNSDDGWDFISQEIPVIVENSWAMGNGYSNSGKDRPSSGNGNGFKIGSSKTGIRHIVRNNVAWGNRASGFYANHSAGGNDWFNNTSYKNGKQYDMWASSWDANGNRTDGVILTGSKVHRMRNNIGYPDNNRNMQGVEFKNNTWDLGIQPKDSDFLSINDAGTKGPRNLDGSLPDLDFLKLRSGSQMINKGIDVGLPIKGGAADLGAYEF